MRPAGAVFQKGGAARRCLEIVGETATTTMLKLPPMITNAKIGKVFHEMWPDYREEEVIRKDNDAFMARPSSVLEVFLSNRGGFLLFVSPLMRYVRGADG
jgi:hypothetical protein